MRTARPKKQRWLSSGLVILGVSGALVVRPRAATNGTTRIDPKITRAIAIGFVSPFDAHARGLHPGAANVVVELSAAANPTPRRPLPRPPAKLTHLSTLPLS